jgi:hypothetical protein
MSIQIFVNKVGMVHLPLEVPERAPHTLILVHSEICFFLQDFDAVIRWPLNHDSALIVGGENGRIGSGHNVNQQIYVDPSTV